MRVAIGLKAHSGWAAAVVIGELVNEIRLIDRRRIELVEQNEVTWAKQPYHAAEKLNQEDAYELVTRGVRSAHNIALREMRAELDRLQENDHEISACALLIPSPMPDWSLAEILSVHFRMHKAEGVLFPEALANAAGACGLELTRINEKRLAEISKKAFGSQLASMLDKLAVLGKAAGPPWGKDQKNAALAAVIALNLMRANSKA